MGTSYWFTGSYPTIQMYHLSQAFWFPKQQAGVNTRPAMIDAPMRETSLRGLSGECAFHILVMMLDIVVGRRSWTVFL